MLSITRHNIQHLFHIDVAYWEHYFALPNETIGEVQEAYSTLKTDYTPDSLWNRYIHKIRYFYNFICQNLYEIFH